MRGGNKNRTNTRDFKRRAYIHSTCLRVDGEIKQTRQRVAQRVQLQLENSQAGVGVGAYADEVIADRTYGQPVHVTVDDDKVEVVGERDAELLIRLVDRADDGAQVLYVYVTLRLLVLEHIVEKLA